MFQISNFKILKFACLTLFAKLEVCKELAIPNVSHIGNPNFGKCSCRLDTKMEKMFRDFCRFSFKLFDLCMCFIIWIVLKVKFFLIFA